MKKFLFAFLMGVFLSNPGFCAAVGDPGVIPMSSISDRRLRDATTGAFLSGGTTPPTPPVAPVAPPPVVPPTTPTLIEGASSAVRPELMARINAAEAAARATTPPPTPKPWYTRVNNSLKNSNFGQSVNNSRVGKIMSGGWGKALGVLGGVYYIYDFAENDEPHTWGDVLKGAALGATVGAAASGVTFGLSSLIGAVVGAGGAGIQMFSETDCEIDPRLGVFTCCNTQFNKGKRWVGVGGWMFCEQPGYVKRCVQGDEKLTYDDSKFKDDYWGECFVNMCDGADSVPKDLTGVTVISALGGIEKKVISEDEKYSFNDAEACWTWQCNEPEGYILNSTLDGCVKSDTVVQNTSDNSGGLSPVGLVNGGATDADINSINALIAQLQQQRSAMMAECLQGLR